MEVERSQALIEVRLSEISRIFAGGSANCDFEKKEV